MNMPSEEGTFFNNRRTHIHRRRCNRKRTNRVRTADVEIATGKLRNVGITIIKQLFCELLFAVPFAFETLAYIFNGVALAVIIGKGIEHIPVLFVHFSVLQNLVECNFIEAAFRIPFRGEILIILVHKFRIFLINVEQMAELHKIIVIEERCQIHPHTVERTAIILVVCTYIYGRITTCVIIFVFCYHLYPIFGANSPL